MAGDKRLVPLHRVRTDGDTQMRVDGLDPDALKRYKAAAAEQGPLGNLLLVQEEGSDEFWMYDGFHRHHVYTELGWAEAPAEVVLCPKGEDPRLAAQKLAFGANQPGVALSLQDRTNIIYRMYHHPAYADMPLVELSRHADKLCVSSQTVLHIEEEAYGLRKPTRGRAELAGSRKGWPLPERLKKAQQKKASGAAEGKPPTLEEKQWSPSPAPATFDLEDGKEPLPAQDNVPPHLRNQLRDPKLGRVISTLKGIEAQFDAGALKKELFDIPNAHHWLWRKSEGGSAATRAMRLFDDISDLFDQAVATLQNAVPVAVCDTCEGRFVHGAEKCPRCEGSGVLPKAWLPDAE
jgi:hypothetical protein